MRLYLILGSICLLALPLRSTAQEPSTRPALVTTPPAQPLPVAAADSVARFPGGLEALRTYLTSAPFPASFQPSSTPARVYVEFVVSPTGQVSHVTPVQPLPLSDQRRLHQQPAVPAAPAELLKAAADLIAAMPAWTPAVRNGKPDFSVQRVPVVFGGTPEAIPLVNTGELPALGPRALEMVARALRYPPSAIHNRVQGVVLVYVEVSEQGRPEKVEIVRSVSQGVDAATKRAVEAALPCQPVRYNGRPVRVCQLFPVTFRTF